MCYKIWTLSCVPLCVMWCCSSTFVEPVAYWPGLAYEVAVTVLAYEVAVTGLTYEVAVTGLACEVAVTGLACEVAVTGLACEVAVIGLACGVAVTQLLCVNHLCRRRGFIGNGPLTVC